MRISDWSSDVCSSDLAEAAPADVGAVGTDLPAGDAPAPPPPGGWYADRIYPADAMEHSRHAMMAENGAQRVGFVSLNLAEYQARKGRDGFRWEGEAWYGRSEEHTSELQSLMRISYAVFCLKKNIQ